MDPSTQQTTWFDLRLQAKDITNQAHEMERKQRRKRRNSPEKERRRSPACRSPPNRRVSPESPPLSRNRQIRLSLTQEEENEKKEATTRSLSLSIGNKTGADFEIQQYKWVPHKESPNPKTKDPHLARIKSPQNKIICTNLKLIKRPEKRMMQHRKIIRLPDSSYQ